MRRAARHRRTNEKAPAVENCLATSLPAMVRHPSFRARCTNAHSRPRYRRTHRSNGPRRSVSEPCLRASISSMAPRNCPRRPSTPRTCVPISLRDPARSEMRRRRQQEPISAGNRTRTAVQTIRANTMLAGSGTSTPGRLHGRAGTISR